MVPTLYDTPLCGLMEKHFSNLPLIETGVQTMKPGSVDTCQKAKEARKSRLIPKAEHSSQAESING
jgi:hypothetical protein